MRVIIGSALHPVSDRSAPSPRGVPTGTPPGVVLLASSGKTPRGRQSTKAGVTRSTKKQARSANRDETATTCAATTVKGTACRLKAQEGSKFCARHATSSKMTASKKSPVKKTPGRNGEIQAKKSAKKATKKTSKKATKIATKKAASEPDSTATATTTKKAVKPRKKPVRKPTRAPSQTTITPQDGNEEPRTKQDPAGAQKDGTTPQPEEQESKAPEPTVDEPETPDDDEFAFYGSEFSTQIEASPYDDLITTEMAEGEEDVELRDENEFGRDRQKPQPPRLSREDAEKKALEKLGPRPEIAPEEDLDDTLVRYDQKFEQEVRRLLGHGGPRGRGRRGGRRRGGGREGPRKRRGRRGGRGRPGRGPRGDGGDGDRGGGGGRGGGGPRRGGRGGTGGGGPRRSGPNPSAARKVGRDSPLAQKRPSKGPKGAMTPRRRRDPDV